MSTRLIPALVVFLLVSFLPAAVGGFFGPGRWYADLAKPSWTPPGWVFGPVWTALYASMGVAAWLVWRRTGLAGAPLAFTLFALQLVLNAAWSWLFFGLQRPDLAFADIVVLWAAILGTLLLFYRSVPAAGLVLLPYLLWVGFAAALNLQIWRLNP
jgi:tryptophan-rich sensory protein